MTTLFVVSSITAIYIIKNNIIYIFFTCCLVVYFFCKNIFTLIIYRIPLTYNSDIHFIDHRLKIYAFVLVSFFLHDSIFKQHLRASVSLLLFPA